MRFPVGVLRSSLRVRLHIFSDGRIGGGAVPPAFASGTFGLSGGLSVILARPNAYSNNPASDGQLHTDPLHRLTSFFLLSKSPIAFRCILLYGRPYTNAMENRREI